MIKFRAGMIVLAVKRGLIKEKVRILIPVFNYINLKLKNGKFDREVTGMGFWSTYNCFSLQNYHVASSLVSFLVLRIFFK